MKHSFNSSSSAFALLLGTLILAGCGGASSFSNPGSTNTSTPPPTDTAPQVVTATPISGFVYGGHAPIQGSHVYLLQPGITGYGSVATSTITGGTLNAGDPAPPGARYVTTDSSGSFNTGAYTCVVGQPVYIYAWGGNFGAGTVFNDNIVQLATLGNCPSSGNFYTAGNGALQFIYLNEVSTVATAYTFQPFTLVTNNDAWHIGTSGTTQALLGIANAANTAAQLYSIQGAGPQSSVPNGESHNANYRTNVTSFNGSDIVTTPNVGNGVVPEATIDSLANIIADCVDSVPTAVGTPTSQCAALFTVARDDGTTTGTQPTDTGTAVINIARFPAGNNSSANVNPGYAAAIFTRQANGPTPYIPQLSSAPNDWTIAINYPFTPVGGYSTSNPDVERAESIQVDQQGQIWITAQAGGGGSTNPSPSADRWSPLGVVNSPNSPPVNNYIFGYVSIDGGNNAWTGNADSVSGIYFANSNGVFNTTYGSGYNSAYTVIANNAGDAFFFAQTAAPTPNPTAPNYGMFEYLPGGTLASPPINISGTNTPTTTVPITITKASETNTGGANPTYTYSFNFTYVGGTPPTPLAVGDTVSLNLANDQGTVPNRVRAMGWDTLTSVTVASVNGNQFTATGTTHTTNSNNGNGATTTAPINITKASEINTGGRNPVYTYTFDFTYVGGTPATPLAMGDTVPLNLTNDPGTGTNPVSATGWQNLTQVTVGPVTNGGTSFTASGTTSIARNAVTTNTVSANTNGPTVSLTINAVTKSAGNAPFTYTFTATNNTTTPLAAGDTVTLALTGRGGNNNNWAALNGAHTVVSATNGNFVITSNTNGGSTADFNNGTGTFFTNGATGTGSYQYTNANGATGTGSYTYGNPMSAGGALFAGTNVGHGAIDHQGDLWITSESGATIARVNAAGTVQFPTIVTATQPEFPAIDAGGNAWIAIQSTPSQIYRITPAGGQTILTSATTGAALTSTFGAAVDGNGNIWFANRCGNYGGCDTPAIIGDSSIVVINGGGSTPGTVNRAISPPQNYIPGAQYPADATSSTPILNGSLNLAIDPSGNLWITNYTGNSVVELVGAAAPVATPLSVAAFNNQLGTKP